MRLSFIVPSTIQRGIFATGSAVLAACVQTAWRLVNDMKKTGQLRC